MTAPHDLKPYRDYAGQHFMWKADGKVGTIVLNRPEKKNALTLDAYAELRDLFRGLSYASDIKAVVICGAGGNFCSGGDVHEIIGPLTTMSMPELLVFTRMTGDLVKAMRASPQPIVAAIDGVCAGAGAMVALASDFRFGTPHCRTAFLFSRVGLAGCDMGACTLLPPSCFIRAGRCLRTRVCNGASSTSCTPRTACCLLQKRWRARLPTDRPSRMP